jgi:hypothetical protein
MARATIADLKDRISDLEDENSALTEVIDDVYNIVAPEVEDEGEPDESDSDD